VKSFLNLQVSLLLVALCGRLANGAEPAKITAPPVKPTAPRSIFTIPASAKDGRDPFYPDSTRAFEVPVSTSHVVEITSLKVKGYSVINGHPMVIINNHSFMVNDEGDVLTPGGRIHVRCLEINANTTVLEVNGQRHTLVF
jgi:hypothetical protein